MSLCRLHIIVPTVQYSQPDHADCEDYMLRCGRMILVKQHPE
jgi:hypothetical protein